MQATARYLQLMLLCQVVISSWGIYQSYLAITNLLKYESTAKKLAEWSSEANNQLQRTRTTQTSGAVAVLTSFLAASALALFNDAFPPVLRFSAAPVLLIVMLLARGHIKNYWAPGDGKTVGTPVPLPNTGDYNEAKRRTEELLQTLEYLEYGWVACSFVAGMLGYS